MSEQVDGSEDDDLDEGSFIYQNAFFRLFILNIWQPFGPVT